MLGVLEGGNLGDEQVVVKTMYAWSPLDYLVTGRNAEERALGGRRRIQADVVGTVGGQPKAPA